MRLDRLTEKIIEFSNDNTSGTILSKKKIERCIISGTIDCESVSGYLVKESDIKWAYQKLNILTKIKTIVQQTLSLRPFGKH